jgi:hypothetical protein
MALLVIGWSAQAKAKRQDIWLCDDREAPDY